MRTTLAIVLLILLGIGLGVGMAVWRLKTATWTPPPGERGVDATRAAGLGHPTFSLASRP
jgi:hypothetical protein